ncbi:hypothetical protein HDA32_005659 [Spinactinospora alkalitolerans]|uniref:Uncharacterized protein n=1 Tax=Spinactinospora alkalitolerans TaxID=687207 RepID=A0A852U2W0_9ACTN|nr:hypothetical protein [Spinactinospora alkalitolerans]NYE50539.1 hypothetical protein [Spinactinospora alkalitolerans]
MQSRRRGIVTAAALVPSALTVLYALGWGAFSLLPGALGLPVALSAVAGLVYGVLPGVDGRRGAAAVSVLGWGAVVPATAAGGAAAAGR